MEKNGGLWILSGYEYHGNSHVNCRRREITLERKQAAEERRRLEEEKAKVCGNDSANLPMLILH